MNSGKRRLAFALSMAISAVFLVLAFRGLQPEQFLSSLTELDLPLLAVAAIVYFVAVVVIALRWQFLLRAVKRVPLSFALSTRLHRLYGQQRLSPARR